MKWIGFLEGMELHSCLQGSIYLSDVRSIENNSDKREIPGYPSVRINPNIGRVRKNPCLTGGEKVRDLLRG